MTQQAVTCVVIGTITLAGNAKATITAAYIPTSPVAVTIPVGLGDNAAAVAALARSYIATTATISAQYATNGTAANVTLIDHQNRANDSTLQIVITNDTCTGLTAATSTSAATGSGLSNAYCTLADAKNWARITTTDANDDSVLEVLINSASRYIDREAQRHFYTGTETRLYDVPLGTELMLDADLQSVTTLTNGDGSIITDYILLPANDTPKYAIRIKPSTSVTWKGATNGNTLQCISVLGSWGLSCPAEIVEACLMIFKAAYNRRFGENMSSITTITAGGLVVTPEDVPAKALQMIYNQRRITFG